MLEFFEPNLATTLTLFVSFIILSLSLVIFLGGKEKASKVFAFSSFVAAIWTFLMGIHIGFVEQEPVGFGLMILDMLPRIMHFLGSVIAAGFFYFCYVFMMDSKTSFSLPLALAVSVAFTAPFYFITDSIVGGPTQLEAVIPLLGGNVWGWEFGSCIFIYSFIFIALFLGGIFILYLKSRRTNDKKEKKQLRIMIGALLVGLFPPAVANIILPPLGYFGLNWTSGIGSFFWVAIVAYSVMKYNQMNVRVVTAEVLILGLTMLLFISLFI